MLTAALLSIQLVSGAPARTIYGAPRAVPEQSTPTLDIEFELFAGWASDYVFRGIELLEPTGQEDSSVYPMRARVELMPGEPVSVFAELFAVAGESDPFDGFGTYQPSVGVTLSPDDGLRLTLGHTTFLYPTVDLDTNEIFATAEVDLLRSGDGAAFTTVFALGTYDYDRFDGVYGEVGLTTRLPGLDSDVLRFEAAIAVIDSYDELFGGDGSGLQHYRVGLVSEIELNELLNVSRQRGRVFLDSELFYTDGIEGGLRAETQLWGGVGLRISY
ncbi:MAG: hypothetical protein AAGD32_09415 [Planctomycetota bacterium]